MKYEYTFRNTPVDIMKFRWENIYNSWTGIFNSCFTLAFIALATKFNESDLVGKIFIVFGICLFPVIQPIGMLIASVKPAHKIKEDTTISFDDIGMHIRVKTHNQTIKWRDFHYILKRPMMLVAVPDGEHCYILTNRVVKKDKKPLYDFCQEHIKKYSLHQNEKKK